MSKDFTKILEDAIKQLVDENKVPSVALVKTKLSEPVPMPLVIQAMQRWKRLGVVPKIEMVEQQPSQEARITELERQVLALSERIVLLESLIGNPKKD